VEEVVRVSGLCSLDFQSGPQGRFLGLKRHGEGFLPESLHAGLNFRIFEFALFGLGERPEIADDSMMVSPYAASGFSLQKCDDSNRWSFNAGDDLRNHSSFAIVLTYNMLIVSMLYLFLYPSRPSRDAHLRGIGLFLRITDHLILNLRAPLVVS
jgi:hypothetical protein